MWVTCSSDEGVGDSASVALYNYDDLIRQPAGCRYKSIQRVEPLIIGFDEIHESVH